MVPHINEGGAGPPARRGDVTGPPPECRGTAPGRRPDGPGRGGGPKAPPPPCVDPLGQLLSGRSVTRRVFSRGLPNPLCVMKRTLSTPSVTVTVYERVRAL